MKFISFVILILMMSYASSRAQDTTSTKLERAGYVVGSSLAFSLIDYVGYSLVRKANYGPALGGTVCSKERCKPRLVTSFMKNVGYHPRFLST